MVKTTLDTLPASAVELPPNKAIAAGGSAGIGSIIVGLGLYYLAPDTPVYIAGMWDALFTTVIAAVVTYFVPHGAVVKE